MRIPEKFSMIDKKTKVIRVLNWEKFFIKSTWWMWDLSGTNGFFFLIILFIVTEKKSNIGNVTHQITTPGSIFVKL